MLRRSIVRLAASAAGSVWLPRPLSQDFNRRKSADPCRPRRTVHSMLALWCLVALLWGGLWSSPAQDQPPCDFGDAPDPHYPALLASNGARHTNTTRAWFGAGVTVEPDSLQVDADTDDGLLSTAPLTFIVTNHDWTNSLYVNVLADLNGDGDWEDPGEWVEQNMQVTVPPGQSRVFQTNLVILPSLQLLNEDYWRYWSCYVAIHAGQLGGSVPVHQNVGRNILGGSLYVPGSLPHGTVVTPWATLTAGCGLLDPCNPEQQEVWIHVIPSPHISPGQSAAGMWP